MTFGDLIVLTDYYLGIEHLDFSIKVVTVIFLLMTIAIFIAFVITLLTLIFHRIYHSWYEKRHKHFSHWLIQYLLDPEMREPDADLLNRHILKNSIQDLLLVTRGYERTLLYQLYVKKGFWSDDLENLKSLYWHRRLEAMVRLDQWQFSLGMKSLESVINDENRHLRQVVLKNLSRTESAEEASYLLDNLNPALTFRSVLVEILSRLIKKHKTLVLHTLNDSTRPELTSHILKAIGDNRVIEAVPDLLRYSKSKDPDIQEKAIISLGKIGDPRGIDVIRDCLSSENIRIRIAALRSLFNVDSDELMKHREKLFEDPSPVVRNWMVHFVSGGK